VPARVGALSGDRQPEAFGTAAAVGAYTLWGLAPLYWPLVDRAAPVEILAHRVVWTLVFVAALLWMVGGQAAVVAAVSVRRTRLLLAVAALLVTVNWGVFIWGVTNGYVLEASLGYFINPLISVLLGVLVLGERLRSLQWAAVGLGTVGVLVITVGYGRLPWVALALAMSFGLYGLVKKQAGVDAIPSLAVETAFAAPFALGYLVWLAAAGSSTFTSFGTGHALLLVGAGAVTAVPLLLFGAAAVRIPLSTLGILQYIGPAVQFVLGLLVFGEAMTPARWAGFLLVWVALAVFTVDLLRSRTARVRMQAVVVPEVPMPLDPGESAEGSP
jgi:chloramphenicol-sensitive protein RarD